MNKNIAIIIPARFASTRLPEKPLIKIKGKEMLLRVYDIAKKAVEGTEIGVFAAIDHEKVENFCKNNKIEYIMTNDVKCNSGSDRVHLATEKLRAKGYKIDFIINFQGDAPLTPPWFLQQFINRINNSNYELLSLYEHLTWKRYYEFAENKRRTPFSGTCVIMDKNNNSIWFSKQIIPAIKNREKLIKKDNIFSPIKRHIGIYAYSFDLLTKFKSWEDGEFEVIEGLEQLRFHEHNITINMLKVDYKGRTGMSGIDSPSDVAIAEELLEKEGEFV